MKYTVKIADTSYEVEIEDIYARPVIARVGGQTFEVNPEKDVQAPTAADAQNIKPRVEAPKQPSLAAASASELTAPLPGTVIEVFVKEEEQIASGQVVLIIEAMKMKNSIRSTRSGKIASVLVGAGQTVAHKQPLIRFAD